MSRINRWQSGTAAFLTLGIMTSAVAPILAPAAASAQTFGQEWRRQSTTSTQITIPSGISIPVRYDKADKIVIAPTETVPLTLTVAANVKNSRGDILIPYGTQVVGKLQPVDGGSQFVAEQLILNQSRRQIIDASSPVISKTTEVRRGINTTSILTGAAVGSAAAAVISGVTGDKKIQPLEVLAGTAAGTAGGLIFGRKSSEVVVINPRSDLTLTLNSDLALAR
jgi:hypothetical protein